MSDLLPLFANLTGRRVVLVGGGAVALSKLKSLVAAGASVSVVAPEVRPEMAQAGVEIRRREFTASDLDDAWLVVAAAPPAVNREVAAAAEARRIFVNAVDDPANASVFLGGVVRRDGVTLAISTNGEAPGLAGLLRQALDRVLPRDLGRWLREARRQRAIWKEAGVPMDARRPLLLQALNRLYDSTDKVEHGEHASAVSACDVVGLGFVSIVGAGPGDPGLLTQRAVERLRAADLVLYDALVDERVLAVASRAQRFYVGKRAGRHALTQHEIEAVMIRAAKRGRRIVRLKGGDPFVFGRGGEEALALQAAGVPFDVVPGVTSAVAAPALAGIPVTHRGLASAFLVASGHDDQLFADAIGALQPDGITVVVMMSLGNRAALASRLIEAGWARTTPAALVAEASLPTQEVWRGALEDLADGRAVVASRGPALFVVGEVARLDLLGANGLEPLQSAKELSSSAGGGAPAR
jgi:uroporphyrin-III C-methyltransferase/precorrin-2 dehydrogenase/sirohydrochlorin ferrochelatase